MPVGKRSVDFEFLKVLLLTYALSFSAEAQINGSDEICGMQFEVVPSIGVVPLPPNLLGFQIFVRTLTGKLITFEVTKETSMCELKR
ncbi:hypothetical protein B0J14DRAFT_573105 [Halenospora varia]|nr:hypothetical protein B0J14DRAFT_573105 [Halenospora varia]